MDGHNGRAPQQSSEVRLFANAFIWYGNNPHRRRFVVDHTNRRFVRNHRRNRRCGRVAGNGNHIQAHAANTGHRFEFVERDFAAFRRLDHTDIFGYGYKRAR